MKIALQISGLLREHEASFESLNKVFNVDNVDLDLYIHTWTNDEESIDDKWGKNGSLVETTTYKNFSHEVKYHIPEVILEINKILEITDYQVESQVNNKELQKFKNNLGSYPDHWSPHNVSCQLYSMYKCNNLRKNSSKKYDLVIKARTELIFENSISFSQLSDILANSSETIFVPEGANYNGGINDQLAIGSPDALDWYCAEGLHYEDGVNPHVMIKKHILKKYKLNRFRLPYTLRGNLFGCREGLGN
jgi:hypothetical protein